MSKKVLSYENKNTWIHRLTGFTKLVFFLMWTLACMLSFDTRILAVMLVFSIIVFGASKTSWNQVGAVFKFVLFFLILNLIAIFIFSPDQGTKIYGTKTVLFHIAGNYDVTAEQLFYELNVLLKYFTITPSIFMFIVTTDPSEFAASLNKIGVSYKLGYSIALALRFIPDIQGDFVKIKNAQAARGIEMSKKAKLPERIKNVGAIILPLIYTSMERIDVVSNAMELRGFGKNRKRTWYMGRKMQKLDYVVILFSVVFFAIAMFITFCDGNRFFNPFK